MNSLIPSAISSTTASLQIEPAYDCDGSLCHQPLFDEDGGLHYVAPHCHLIEADANGLRYHAVFCDFPSVPARA